MPPSIARKSRAISSWFRCAEPWFRGHRNNGFASSALLLPVLHFVDFAQPFCTVLLIMANLGERLDVIAAQYRVMVTHFAINPLADRAEISKRGRFRHSQNCESMKPSTVPRVPITPIHASQRKIDPAVLI
jgi:hypothetical protein